MKLIDYFISCISLFFKKSDVHCTKQNLEDFGAQFIDKMERNTYLLPYYPNYREYRNRRFLNNEIYM